MLTAIILLTWILVNTMGRRNLELRSPLGRQQNDPRLRLWAEFLRISPSYSIAQKVIRGDLPLADARKAVRDIDEVIRVARNFGDVWAQDTEQLWTQKSFDLFGVRLAEPDLKVVHVMQAGEPINEREMAENIREYSMYTREEMGNPLTVLVSIPIDMNRQQLVSLFGGMLTYFKENRHDYDNAEIPEPKYTLSKSKKPLRSLRQLLDFVYYRAKHPQLRLWEIGHKFRVSPVFSEKIDSGAKLRGEMAESVGVMNAMLSRLYKQALLVAENAARGTFPSIAQAKDFPTAFDFYDIQENLEPYMAQHPSWNPTWLSR